MGLLFIIVTPQTRIYCQDMRILLCFALLRSVFTLWSDRPSSTTKWTSSKYQKTLLQRYSFDPSFIFAYRWRHELKKKEHDSQLADQSITILLHNILPAHVGMVHWFFVYIEHPIISSISRTVDVFISNEAKHELYYEEFENVSIMFASLEDFELELSHLRVLNEIITEFDKVVRWAMIISQL